MSRGDNTSLVELPSQWHDDATTADNFGPATYSLTLNMASSDDPTQRQHLVLDGVMNQAYVWIDDLLLGDIDGYCTKRRWDVTNLLSTADTHEIRIEVSCPPLGDRRRKRALTGAYQHSLFAPPNATPGGIGVVPLIVATGSLCIDSLDIKCRDISSASATIEIATQIDALTTCSYNLDYCLTDKQSGRVLATGTEVHQATSGINAVTVGVSIANPPLWWPKELGDPALVQLDVTVSELQASQSDRVTRSFGIREVETNNFITRVNGKQIYLRGINCGPWSMSLANYATADFEADFATMQHAGLNMIRLQAHVAPDALYAAADQAGLLIWQDLPLQWGYARRTLPAARQLATNVVKRIAHHPSILLWCVHSTPVAYDIEEFTGAWRGPRWRNRLRGIRAQLLPTYNRTMLDTSVSRTIGRLDTTREVVSHTGMLPTLATPGTTFNSSFGWSYGDERSFARFVTLWPRAVRFVSEIGPQSATANTRVPADRVLGANTQLLIARINPDDYATTESWVTATQAYQAMVIRHHVEALRRCKYRPNGGFAISAWAPTSGPIGHSVYGPESQHDDPKLAWAAIANACAPMIVVAQRPLPAYQIGVNVNLAIHVVNDRHIGAQNALCKVNVTSPDGVHQQQFVGDIAADDVTFVGAINYRTTTTGTIRIDIVVDLGDQVVTNHYVAEVV